MTTRSSAFEVCQLCGECNETVLDGICEMCEPVWLDQIEALSKQMPGSTGLAKLFSEAGKTAQEKIVQQRQAPSANN